MAAPKYLRLILKVFDERKSDLDKKIISNQTENEQLKAALEKNAEEATLLGSQMSYLHKPEAILEDKINQDGFTELLSGKFSGNRYLDAAICLVASKNKEFPDSLNPAKIIKKIYQEIKDLEEKLKQTKKGYFVFDCSRYFFDNSGYDLFYANLFVGQFVGQEKPRLTVDFKPEDYKISDDNRFNESLFNVISLKAKSKIRVVKEYKSLYGDPRSVSRLERREALKLTETFMYLKGALSPRPGSSFVSEPVFLLSWNEVEQHYHNKIENYPGARYSGDSTHPLSGINPTLEGILKVWKGG